MLDDVVNNKQTTLPVNDDKHQYSGITHPPPTEKQAQSVGVFESVSTECIKTNSNKPAHPIKKKIKKKSARAKHSLRITSTNLIQL